MSIAGTPRVTPELIGGLLLRRQIDASLLGGGRVRGNGGAPLKEVRRILRTAIKSTQAEDRVEPLGSRIHVHCVALGGVELELPERSSARSAGARLGQQP